MSNALIHGNLLTRSNKMADELTFLRQEMNQHLAGEVLGSQHGLKMVMDHVTQVAALDSPVLIMGETGVGKEVIANAVHRMSGRFDQPLVKINCGAIPPELIDSELFGHEKGAFTGALSRKAGRFERANGGTLFLDEVGELPLKAQVRLLRVLQEHEIERVGGSETIPVDVRVISATNKNLPDLVTRGRFREDLWYRLNVYPIMIPPLRERTVDIPDLAHYFLEQKAAELNLSGVPTLNSKALDQLVNYHWPGNVRELQNVIERALIHFGRQPLDFTEILNIAPAGAAVPAPEVRDQHLSFEEMSRRHIQEVLKGCDGKISGAGGAAEILDLHPNTLRNKMLKLGIPFPGQQ
jgi:transcriptional regulator with GAF, ATPase, and Fis domain